MLSDPDPARSRRAVQAMLGMQKLDIAALERANEEQEHCAIDSPAIRR